MSQSFSVGPYRSATRADGSLQDEINRHTENGEATERILRSIERFGTDPSIVRFEVIPAPHARGLRFASLAWTVRAIRLEPTPAAPIADAPGS